MRKLLLFASLGYLGYLWYNRYYKNAIGTSSGSDQNPETWNNVRTDSDYAHTSTTENWKPGYNTSSTQGTDPLTFDSKIESQLQKGEGLTDESKTGIND